MAMGIVIVQSYIYYFDVFHAREGPKKVPTRKKCRPGDFSTNSHPSTLPSLLSDLPHASWFLHLVATVHLRVHDFVFFWAVKMPLEKVVAHWIIFLASSNPPFSLTLSDVWNAKTYCSGATPLHGCFITRLLAREAVNDGLHRDEACLLVFSWKWGVLRTFIKCFFQGFLSGRGVDTAFSGFLVVPTHVSCVLLNMETSSGVGLEFSWIHWFWALLTVVGKRVVFECPKELPPPLFWTSRRTGPMDSVNIALSMWFLGSFA